MNENDEKGEMRVGVLDIWIWHCSDDFYEGMLKDNHIFPQVIAYQYFENRGQHYVKSLYYNLDGTLVTVRRCLSPSNFPPSAN